MDRSLTVKAFCDWPRLALILAIAYFSQVYPYAHFHHSHDAHGLPVEISLHPVDVSQDALADHHEDGHHHHTFDQSVDDWNRIRSYSKSSSLLTDLQGQVCGGMGPDAEPRITARVCDGGAPPESTAINIFICRGPPTVS